MTRKPNFKFNWKYALGEIVLIFIGISLAIGFQNWNESRKDGIKINGYLATIADNLSSDSLEIVRFIETSKRKEKDGKKYLSAVKQKQPDFQAFMGGMVQLEEEYLNINNNGFEGLKASGYLSNIQSSPIEDALFNYYSYFDEIHELELSYNQFVEAQELEFVKNVASAEFMIMVTDIYLNKRTPNLNAQEQKKLEQIFNHPSIVSISLRAGFLERHYDELLQKGNKLKRLIKERAKQ
ncbi:hypothetical protein [Roseivirga misakiensis]|uniref:Uncharacterized protein n=1 Tax=Roseivirga misakiensis TaxID=1563681 RepID=A0A1E5T4C5_9BACT|nr:hypothetical protein [Roseivirga misakiensis]OEK06243.1 hypothetical protein BFP71_00785 [Roseivirga misakiensis]